MLPDDLELKFCCMVGPIHKIECQERNVLNCFAGTSFDEAVAKANEIAKAEGRTFVHAFNDKHIVAGQGTVGVELMEQNAFLVSFWSCYLYETPLLTVIYIQDAVVIPIGGGGLIAGTATFLKHVNPRIKVYGVQTTAMPGMYLSLKSQKVVPVPKKPTMADGIAVGTIGDVPLEVIKDYVDDIVLVDENEVSSSSMCLSLDSFANRCTDC